MDPLETLSTRLDAGPITIVVKPGKRENRIVGTDPVTIEINARPIEGAANRELLGFLKDTVGPCRIVSGTGSRKKRIERQ